MKNLTSSRQRNRNLLDQTYNDGEYSFHA